MYLKHKLFKVPPASERKNLKNAENPAFLLDFLRCPTLTNGLLKPWNRACESFFEIEAKNNVSDF